MVWGPDKYDMKSSSGGTKANRGDDTLGPNVAGFPPKLNVPEKMADPSSSL